MFWQSSIQNELSDIAKCYLCGRDTETISYLFWKCHINKKLCERLKDMMNKCLGYNLTLFPEKCMFTNHTSLDYSIKAILIC